MFNVTIEGVTYTFEDEKGMEAIMLKLLKSHGWFAVNQIYTDQGNRLDILACHHSAQTDYIIFELKCFKTLVHYWTKPFKQIMDKYYNKRLTWKGISTNIVCLITPYSLETMCPNNEELRMCITRYYWRMGFGIGSIEKMFATFTSQCSDGYFDLLNPNTPYHSLEKQFQLIKERQH